MWEKFVVVFIYFRTWILKYWIWILLINLMSLSIEFFLDLSNTSLTFDDLDQTFTLLKWHFSLVGFGVSHFHHPWAFVKNQSYYIKVRELKRTTHRGRFHGRGEEGHRPESSCFTRQHKGPWWADSKSKVSGIGKGWEMCSSASWLLGGLVPPRICFEREKTILYLYLWWRNRVLHGDSCLPPVPSAYAVVSCLPSGSCLPWDSPPELIWVLFSRPTKIHSYLRSASQGANLIKGCTFLLRPFLFLSGE